MLGRGANKILTLTMYVEFTNGLLIEIFNSKLDCKRNVIMKKILKFVLSAFLFTGMLLSIAQAEDDTKKPWQCITITEISMLNNAYPTGKIIDKIPKGTTLNVLEETKDKLSNQNWLRVRYGGKNGWISEILVDKVHPTTDRVENSKLSKKPGEKWLKIITPENRARLSPIPDSVPQNKELTRIKTGTELKIQDISVLKSLNPKFLPDTKWYKVSYGGKTGWVSQYDIEDQK